MSDNHEIAVDFIKGHKFFVSDSQLLHNTKQIVVPHISGSTYKTSYDFTNMVSSAGKISGGEFTDNGDGSVTVSAGTGLIRATDDVTAEIKFFDWSETTLTLADGDTNYIYVDYNSGSPSVTSSTSLPSDHNTKILLGLIYREGTTLHEVSAGQLISNFQTNIVFKDITINGKIQRASGIKIGETGTRNFSLTSGIVYAGLTKVSMPAFDSSGSDTFTYYYRDGSGGWTKVTGQTQIDNLHYDDGSGTLATLTGSGWFGNYHYGVHWVYQDIDGDVFVVYGQDDYTLSEAQVALPPAELPDLIQEVGMLVGKITIKKNDDSFTAVESPFDTKFVGTGVVNHNDLGAIQGGTSDEYYHLTQSAYDNLYQQDQEVLTTSDVNFNNLTLSGNLTVNGSTITQDVEQVTIQDNTLVLNSGETGSGITAGMAGLIFDRGTADDYGYIYDESTNLFRIGKYENDSGTVDSSTNTTVVLGANGSDTDDIYNGKVIKVYKSGETTQFRTITDYDGSTKTATVDSAWDTNPDSTWSWEVNRLDNTQALATREDSPQDEGIAVWNSSDNRFNTSSHFTFKNYGSRSWILTNQEMALSDTFSWERALIIGFSDSQTTLKDYYNNNTLSLQFPTIKIGVDENISLTDDTNLKITTPYGYTSIGAKNGDWSHFYTDRPSFYFNTKITVDGGMVSSYDEDLSLQRAGTTLLTLEDSGNITIGNSSVGGTTTMGNTLSAGSFTFPTSGAATFSNWVFVAEHGFYTNNGHAIYMDLDHTDSTFAVRNTSNDWAFYVKGDTAAATLYLDGSNIYHRGALFCDAGGYISKWMYAKGDKYGNGIYIGAGGQTVIGAGESAATTEQNTSAGDETLYLTSDGKIKFISNLQSGWSSGVTAQTINSDGTVTFSKYITVNGASGYGIKFGSYASLTPRGGSDWIYVRDANDSTYRGVAAKRYYVGDAGAYIQGANNGLLYLNDSNGTMARQLVISNDNNYWHFWDNHDWSYYASNTHFYKKYRAWYGRGGWFLAFPSGTSLSSGSYAQLTKSVYLPSGNFRFSVSVFADRRGSTSGYWYAYILVDGSEYSGQDIGSSSDWNNLSVDLSGLSAGNHTIGVRLKCVKSLSSYSIAMLALPFLIEKY